MTPPDGDPAGPSRVLFQPEDVEQQLDQLVADIAALRDRVQHLVGLVPSDAVLRVVTEVEVDRTPRSADLGEPGPKARAVAGTQGAPPAKPEKPEKLKGKKHKKGNKHKKKSKPQLS